MHDGSMIGWFYPLTEQSLRSEPDGDEVGGFWSMDDVGQRPDLLVQKQKGDWIEVMVDTRQNVCGSNPQEPDGPVGWLRLVNDDGHPLIYWYTRGC